MLQKFINSLTETSRHLFETTDTILVSYDYQLKPVIVDGEEINFTDDKESGVFGIISTYGFTDSYIANMMKSKKGKADALVIQSFFDSYDTLVLTEHQTGDIISSKGKSSFEIKLGPVTITIKDGNIVNITGYEDE